MEPTPLPWSQSTDLIVEGARQNNLKNISLRIPHNQVTAITGVSGSGKSSLAFDTLFAEGQWRYVESLSTYARMFLDKVNRPDVDRLINVRPAIAIEQKNPIRTARDTLYRAVARAFRVESLPMGKFRAIKGIEHLTGIKLIDQEPIGRTPRSNPITYLKAFDEVRALFASERDALRRGLTPGHFSFNTTGGRCDRCEGSGVEKLEMYFFEDIYATCEACDGKRFKPDVLSIRYRGKTIHDVLQMTAEEALGFFSGSPKLAEKLHLLSSIGLGYLRLGQAATTLSGGEAQRLKIAAELIAGRGLSKGTDGGRTDRDRRRPSTSSGRSQSPDVLYIMDEPTTGLHVEDIKKLLAMLQKLVNSGNTVVVVEHNLDVIKCADWIIDLGPEGGAAGGQIVAEGRPEQVARVTASHTGQFLAPLLAEEQRAHQHL
ncbi:MAG: hypothetical protein E8D50_01165 [Nitrospira sp.]|nr:MAG: hypothetical protein E8D50_01165 [Nitrospira sp.]